MTHRQFFGHLRQGLRAAVPDGNAVTVKLEIGGTRPQTPSVTLPIAGPGAVEAIVPTAIRTRHPAPGTVDFRAGALPFISFHQPGLPWAFSEGAVADAVLRPFLGLICVPENGVALQDAGQIQVATITAADPALPDPAVFAHLAHIEDPDAGADTPGDRAFSRILSAQNLSPFMDYQALLVPLTEVGRAAALGQDPRAGKDAAWDGGETTLPQALPVFASWRFRTGPARGAEDILRDLRAIPPEGQPAAVPPIQTATALVPNMSSTVPRRAVFTVETIPAADDPAFVDALDPGPIGGRLPLPHYGAEHAAGTPNPPRWLREINQDAGLRVMAGHGAALVRRHQDDIIGFILDDIGALEEANAVLARAHSAMLVTKRIHKRLQDKSPDLSSWLRLAGPAAQRTGVIGGSLSSRVAGTAGAALSDPALRRSLAAGGALDRDSKADTSDLIPAMERREVLNAQPPDIATPLGRDFQHALGGGGSVQGPADERLGARKILAALAEAQPVPLRPIEGGNDAFEDLTKTLGEDRRRPDRPDRMATIDNAASLPFEIAQALDPAQSVPPRIRDRITGVDLPEPLPPRIEIPEPVWPKPLLELLFKHDPATLSPSLAHLPPDGVMALQLDAATVDAVMAGANDEVLRELRWRGIPVPFAVSPVRRMYPALSDGTPALPDSKPMVDWGNRAVGAGRSSAVGLVVLIRSALFRRFPGSIVTLVEAQWSAGSPKIREASGRVHKPVIMGDLGPDLVYLGFEPSRDAMVGDPDPANRKPGGFLVFEQTDQGISFGLNATNAQGAGGSSTWNALSWDDLQNETLTKAARPTGETRDSITWGANAASMAAILLERPVTLALHVSDLTGE
ncbi:hypothetical protein [Algirhabdus cladophorae]|uniref:hypothetical protein n=1 Tax=Algirhabdus cladophorae TaxID=3377108 RepID=UPI003B84AC98